VCSVRLLRRKPSGVVRLTLRSGPVVIASGRGRITNGVARVRLRVHLPVASGGYALRAEVDRGSGKKPITRLLTVGLLGDETA
jgi:hypothetical protein